MKYFLRFIICAQLQSYSSNANGEVKMRQEAYARSDICDIIFSFWSGFITARVQSDVVHEKYVIFVITSRSQDRREDVDALFFQEEELLDAGVDKEVWVLFLKKCSNFARRIHLAVWSFNPHPHTRIFCWERGVRTKMLKWGCSQKTLFSRVPDIHWYIRKTYHPHISLSGTSSADR